MTMSTLLIIDDEVEKGDGLDTLKVTALNPPDEPARAGQFPPFGEGRG